MNPKPIIIATCCAISIVVGVYFVGRYLLERGRIEVPTLPVTPHTVISPKVRTSKGEPRTIKDKHPSNAEHQHSEELQDPVHAELHDTGQPHLHSFEDLSPEERKQIFKAFYHERGLKPPPKGYDYRWADIDVPLLDDQGNPILHKIGEPIVDIEIRVGFAPTQEEYKRYTQLERDKYLSEQQGDTVQASKIAAEIKQLESDAQRERPFLKNTLWVASPAEVAKDPHKAERLAREKLNAALREYGLGHLISPYPID